MPSHRDTMRKSARIIHDTFADPVTVHFQGHDMIVSARSNREGAVIGQDGYAQALVMANQLIFMIEDLEGRKLIRGLSITTADGVASIGLVHPPDGGRVRCDISY